MIDWKRDLKDAMWSMFWPMQYAGDTSTESDKAALKANVARLIRMTTQKTAGQRLAKWNIDWDSLEHVIMAIVCEATSLALAGEFGEMPEMIDE